MHSSLFSLAMLAHSSLTSIHQGGGDPQLEDLTITSSLNGKLCINIKGLGWI